MKSPGLKVLCIHGEGLQGLSPISIIDELCGQVAQQSGLSRCPRPCDLFDVICGTGIGAFIAILLGRYGLDTSRCKQLYMDMSTFIEERKRMRHLNDSSASIGPGDMEKFMDILISEEGWSNQLEVPVLEDCSTCQHVFLMQNHNSYGAESPNRVYHGGVGPKQKSRRSSHPTASVSPSVSGAIGVCVAHGLNRWVSEAALDLGEHTNSQIHAIVLSMLEEIWNWYPFETNIDYLVNVGPSRFEKRESPISLIIPVSPRKWVSDKTSLVRSVTKWPIKQTRKTRSKLESSIKSIPTTTSSFPFLPIERTKRLPILMNPLGLDTNSPEDAGLGPNSVERRDMAKMRLGMLLVGSGFGKRYFNLHTSSGRFAGDISDMVDLKETRHDIRILIDSLSGDGMLGEVARRLIHSNPDH